MSNQEFIQDILREIFNISVGKAAEMLSNITNKKIVLDIPKIIMNEIDESEELKKDLSPMVGGALMISSITFDAHIRGEANLIFPIEKMKSFINLCIEEGIESAGDDLDFVDMDFDILKEIGNIILNSIMGGMANFLNINMEYTMPEVRLLEGEDLKGRMDFGNYPCNILLYISFVIEDAEIEGAIIIELTIDSLNELINKIKTMEEMLYA